MIPIPGVLTPDALKKITAELSQAKFVDGKYSGGVFGGRGKKNLQLKREGSNQDFSEAELLVITGLTNNILFQSFVRPRTVLRPTFAKYEPGMEYAGHVDSAIMAKGQLVRADLSVTIFLNSPKEYAGGELSIATAGGERKIKLEAGDAFVYPADTHHRVMPVTRGTRLVAVTWVQSLIRNSQLRQILHDLNAVVSSMIEKAPAAVETELLVKSHENLLRLFSDV
jgi:PKHD-type hydroxylase